MTSLLWRRLDVAGLERLVWVATPDGVTAAGSLVCAEAGGFSLTHDWQLDAAWRTLALTVAAETDSGPRSVAIARAGTGWCVDGMVRPDLDGALEPDLSATPFCNSLAIRRMDAAGLATLTLDTVFIDAPTLRIMRSRQRYDRLDTQRVRYTDLGSAAGFTAELRLDEQRLVTRYEHLFERA